MPNRGFSKYRAQRTEVDGIVFHSKKEAKRYGELKLMLMAGAISKLEMQKPFPCKVGNSVICTWRADFCYIEGGRWIVEDTKGFRTPEYKIKKKLVEAIYGITIRET